MGSDGSNDPVVTDQISRNEPPEFLVPFLQNIATAGQAQAEIPREFFPGQTFSPEAPETELARELQTSRALAGSPTVDAANTQLQQTLGGDFLQNPFQDDLQQSILRSVLPSVQAQFSGSGRGGGLEANALATGVADRLAPLAFQNFNNERGRQLQAVGLAPGLAQSDFADAQALAQVGQSRQGFAQQAIDESINRFNFGQVEPIERLQNFSNLLGQTNFGNVSTSQSSATQPGSSTLADIAGAGLLGAGALGSLGLRLF